MSEQRRITVTPTQGHARPLRHRPARLRGARTAVPSRVAVRRPRAQHPEARPALARTRRSPAVQAGLGGEEEPRMWIAQTPNGDRVEAARNLEAGAYHCPMCQSAVILKRGQKVTAHFAHAPDSECPASEAESWRHLMAKQVLVEELTALGWEAHAEIVHQAHGRRVDVGLKAPSPDGATTYIAIEIQDSAIQVDTMKERIAKDRRIGYHATVWLFTSHRAAALLAAQPRHEVRIPDEMLWVANRYGQGVHIVDPQAREIWAADLGCVYREQDTEFAASPIRALRKTKHITRRRAGFVPALAPGKFGDRWAVAFTADHLAAA